MRRKIIAKVSLFTGMYAITATIIGIETGSVATGLTLGLLGSSLKTVWAMAHSALFRVAH
jgi:hypothetical protein